jgi:hypothetical protein
LVQSELVTIRGGPIATHLSAAEQTQLAAFQGPPIVPVPGDQGAIAAAADLAALSGEGADDATGGGLVAGCAMRNVIRDSAVLQSAHNLGHHEDNVKGNQDLLEECLPVQIMRRHREEEVAKSSEAVQQQGGVTPWNKWVGSFKRGGGADGVEGERGGESEGESGGESGVGGESKVSDGIIMEEGCEGDGEGGGRFAASRESDVDDDHKDSGMRIDLILRRETLPLSGIGGWPHKCASMNTRIVTRGTVVASEEDRGAGEQEDGDSVAGKEEGGGTEERFLIKWKDHSYVSKKKNKDRPHEH